MGFYDRRKSRPTAVGDIVSAFLRRSEGKDLSPRKRKPSRTVAVFEAFATLGPPITTHAEPVLFRGGVLTLVIEDTSWLTEATFLRGEIIPRVNAILGKDEITDIRVRHGQLSKPARQVARPPPPPPELRPDQAAWLDEIGSAIEDDDVRAAVVRAARWSLTR